MMWFRKSELAMCNAKADRVADQAVEMYRRSKQVCDLLTDL